MDCSGWSTVWSESKPARSGKTNWPSKKAMRPTTPVRIGLMRLHPNTPPPHRPVFEFMDPTKTEMVVVGAGPGGYAAAFYAADLGKKVIMVEQDKRLGGVCLNRGCIPSKAYLHAAKVMIEARESAHRGITFSEPKLEVEKLRAWKESILTKLSGGVAQLA